MNFFDAQSKAQRATRWLVVVYVVATLLIVAGVTAIVWAAFYNSANTARVTDPSLLIAAALATVALILGSTLYKTAVLSSGGGRVALDLGGTLVPPDVRDPLRRRLRNVVEEMAIASGVPVPEIYVLESENGINAFAAGFAPTDAAIALGAAVARGAHRAHVGEALVDLDEAAAAPGGVGVVPEELEIQNFSRIAYRHRVSPYIKTISP